MLASGCGLSLSSPNSATPTLFIITATLPPPGSFLLPAKTLAQPTQLPTAESIEGITATQVNVRSDPSTASTLLGMIGSSTKVQIIGKDPSGNWVQIIFPQAPNGKGWLTVQYVNVKFLDAIPVIGIATGSGSGQSGVIIQQVNVRSGPGTDFDTLGIMNPKDVVSLTGKDASGIWLQIQFTKGADGKGWVTAAYVQASGLETLPIVGQTGKIVGTGTPTSIPATVTPTLVAAPQDNDSAQAPAVVVTFSPSGARSLIYSSEVSTPNGDPEDWIQFTPYSIAAIASLACSGNGRLNVDLWQNGAHLQNWGSLACDESDQLSLSPGQPYLMHLIAIPKGGELEIVQYTISIYTTP